MCAQLLEEYKQITVLKYRDLTRIQSLHRRLLEYIILQYFARRNLADRKRLWYSHIFENGIYTGRQNKVPFKHNVSWAKGAVHVAATRAFVDYLLHSEVGKVSTYFSICFFLNFLSVFYLY